LLLEQGAQLLAALNGLMAGAVAQGGQDFGGGLDAQIARKQHGFKSFEGGFVYGSGEGDDVFDFGREGLAGARDGLLHAAEKAGLGVFGRAGFGVVGLATKELHGLH